MNNTVGIGIIGAGFRGMLHARALSQLPGQPDPIQLYSDYRKLLEKPNEGQG